MEEEISALVRRGTWDIVYRPADANVVSCRWVFTIKYNPDETVNRYKARLVVRGFSQVQGIDYEETFSPIVRVNSIGIFLSMAVNYAWPLHQLDVSNAFLYGDLTECVYMEQPPGYSIEGENDKVCLLRRALYGLKQSPRAWFEKFSALVSDRELVACDVEPTVFRKITSTGCVILAVYVEDMIITESDYAGILDIKAFLQHHLDIRDLGEPKYFLCMEFASCPRALVLNQRKYVLDLLQEAGLSGCKPYASPIDSKPQLWSTTSPLYSDPKRYRRLVGKLIYLTLTRPDIAFTVNVLSQFMHALREVHWEAAIRLLAYLKYAPGRELIF